jgi:hypothetical protein
MSVMQIARARGGERVVEAGAGNPVARRSASAGGSGASPAGNSRRLVARLALGLVLFSFGCGDYGGSSTRIDGSAGTDGPDALTVSAPSDRSAEATGALTAVAIGSASASGGAAPLTITHDAPAGGFGVGVHTVTWTVTDATGETDTDTQRVTVSEIGSIVGDPAAGASAYAANCRICHGGDPATNISNILNGSTVAGIEHALDTVNAMRGLSSSVSQPQTLANLAAFIAAADDSSPPPPSGETCAIDEDPMQPIALQRLSKRQYANTLRDLIRMQLGAANANAVLAEIEPLFDQIPDDNLSHGFASFDQSVSASHVEGWFNVAWTIASEITGSSSLLVDFVGESCATNASDASCRERFLQSFGARALRHPLSAQELAFYRATTSYRDLITQLLVAPGFLNHEQYRGDLDPLDPDRTSLSPYELASKLSYHFWQTMPDQALFNAAASGEIENDFASVVDDVFRDPRTREGMKAFFGGWLRLDEIPPFDPSKPERANFLAEDYGFGTDLPTNLDLVAYRQAAIDEVLALADYTTFVSDGSLADLFTSNGSFATNAALAEAYGVTPWAGGSNPPVPFPASQPRAGLLTRAALQMYGDFESHPILKGARIRTEILCDEIVAPADIATPEEAVLHPNFSTRERTEAITEISGTACAGCHTPFINPVGFPSENFDAIGRFRTEEVLYDDAGDEFFRALVETTSTPRLASGEGGGVDDAIELSARVATHEKTGQCFARNYYRYEHRRMEVDSTDSCEVNALQAALEADGLQGMLKAAALLPEFKLRTMSN